MAGGWRRVRRTWWITSCRWSPITAIWVAANDGNLYRFDGSAWAWETAFAGPIEAMAGTSEADRWVFGAFSAYHFDGDAWTQRPTSPFVAFSLADAAGAEVWAVSAGRMSYRWDGAAWEEMGSLPDPPSDLEVVGPGDVYAAISRRYILHHDGVTWSPIALPTVEDVIRIDSTAPDDVFAITSTQVFHFDGTAWTEVRIAAPLVDVSAHPHVVDVVRTVSNNVQIESVLRTRPWSCRATETACTDGVDDDCDGVLDDLDTDCP